MQAEKFSTRALLTAIAFGMLSPALLLTAQQGKALHSFHDTANNDGYNPYGGVIFDPSGNLYGTTFYGGTHGLGTLYELRPAAGGNWTETILHSFGGNSSGEASPDAGLVIDKAGNLYGTTNRGGTYGFGTVIELIQTSGGGWTEKILHSFNANINDGAFPQARLVFDTAGNLYGTTASGGVYGSGTVFELKPKTGGVWTEGILHSFNNKNHMDGVNPQAGLVLDAAGNLYGTTAYGGTYNGGIVFEMKSQAGGAWTEQVLHSFSGVLGGDGAAPYSAGVILDSSGNLYGTTYSGGAFNDGIVYELSPSSSGIWTETILFTFNGYSGEVPNASLVFDSSGNLYGTTGFGGLRGLGDVFELTKVAGVWTEIELYGFTADGGAGAYPSSLVLDPSGNLYGTIATGGAYNSGAVFEVTP